MNQDIIIATQSEECIARGQFDGKQFFSGDPDTVIQKSIDLVAEQGGGQVRLLSGNYLLATSLQLRNRVHLNGAGRATVLLLQENHSNGIGIEAQGLREFTLSDLSIRAAQPNQHHAGVVLNDCGDSQVRDLHCQDFADYGLLMENNSFLNEIRSCKLSNNGKANLRLSNNWCGRGGDWVPNLISNCICFGGGTGIEIERSLLNNIIGCQVFQAGGYGFHLFRDGGSNVISGCRTFQIERDAVRVENSNELNISSNIFCWHRGNGIVFNNIGCGTISSNEIIDSGVRTRDDSLTNAILLENKTRSIQVSGNAIFNFGDQCPMERGIVEDDTCIANNVVGNSINYTTEEAVQLEGEKSQAAYNLSESKLPFLNNTGHQFPDYNRDRLKAFLEEGRQF